MTKFLFTQMVICIAIGSHAQNNTSKKLEWGYKIGLNGSNLRVENTADFNWKTGLATGLFFNIKLGKSLSLQPEALYSSMGARNVIDGSGSLRLNYFSLPVVAKYTVCKNLSAIAGPQIDMLIQAKTKSSNNSFTKVTDDYNESSFNLTAGVEYWPTNCIGFSGRYIYGLSDVTPGGTEAKNQGVQIMAAVRF